MISVFIQDLRKLFTCNNFSQKFVKKRNFCQKSKFLSDIEIFIKNLILSKIQFFGKQRNFHQKLNFVQNPNFREKYKKHKNFFDKNRNFR